MAYFYLWTPAQILNRGKAMHIGRSQMHVLDHTQEELCSIHFPVCINFNTETKKMHISSANEGIFGKFGVYTLPIMLFSFTPAVKELLTFLVRFQITPFVIREDTP